MKDSLALLLAAGAMALGAWCFWHYLGTNAMDIFVCITIVGLAVDNMRLRRVLRAQK
jgi:hypothetical protein